MKRFCRISWPIAYLAIGGCALPEYTKNLKRDTSIAGSSTAGNNSGGTSHGGTASGGHSTSVDGGRSSKGGASGASGSGTGLSGGNGGTNAATTVGGTTSTGGTSAAKSLGGTTGTGGTSAAKSLGGTTGTGGTSAAKSLGGTTGTGGTSTTVSWTQQCGSGWKSCLGPCDTEIISDPDNCGDCARKCEGGNAKWSCQSFSCGIRECSTGWANCDNRTTTGCEVDLTASNVEHCGACNSPCKNSVCGTNNGASATAYCYPLDTWGIALPTGAYQGRALDYLQGVKRPIGTALDPVLAAMGVVETNSGVSYYLALYTDNDNHPGSLVWASAVQLSQGTRAVPHTNEISIISEGKALEPGRYYWQMILVYNVNAPGMGNSLEIGVSETSAGTEPQIAYTKKYTTLPLDLSGETAWVDETQLLYSPATYIRVSVPRKSGT